MKAITFILALLGAIAFFNTPSHLRAATYFIDGRNGSDTNPGTLNAPWKKIAKANSTLRAGDIVYIKSGIYEEPIRPVNSGSKGQYITYARYQNDDAAIGGNIYNAADLSDRQWIKIDGLSFTATYHYWINFLPNGNYNSIVNCTFEGGTSMGWAGLMLRGGAHHNQIINNHFSTECKPDDLIYVFGSSYNLIEGNYIGNAAHYALNIQSVGGKSEYNIVRNNIIENKFHGSVGIWRSANHTIVEGNKIINSGARCGSDGCPANSCGSDRDKAMDRDAQKGLQLSSQYCIVRNNIFINNGTFTLESWTSDTYPAHNRIYNNTFYGNYNGIEFQSSGEYPFTDNIVKNNIVANSVYKNLYLSSKVSSTDNQLINNRISNSIILGNTLSTNLNISATYDFQSLKDNQMVDNATWLAVITSADGEGNAFIVSDARYFSDGYGISDGDRIQIENQATQMKIVSIDYDRNKIVLDRSVKWKKGAGVSLPYGSDAPDLGAIEEGLTHLNAPTLSIKAN